MKAATSAALGTEGAWLLGYSGEMVSNGLKINEQEDEVVDITVPLLCKMMIYIGYEIMVCKKSTIIY